MKKMLLIIVLTFGSLFANAQMFDGVPVNGDLDVYIKKMKDKKYTLVKMTESGAIMDGYLANQ